MYGTAETHPDDAENSHVPSPSGGVQSLAGVVTQIQEHADWRDLSEVVALPDGALSTVSWVKNTGPNYDNEDKSPKEKRATGGALPRSHMRTGGSNEAA